MPYPSQIEVEYSKAIDGNKRAEVVPANMVGLEFMLVELFNLSHPMREFLHDKLKDWYSTL